MNNDGVIRTPAVPLDLLGISEQDHQCYVVNVRRESWTVFQRQAALQLYRRDVWRPVLTTFDQSEAQAFLDNVTPAWRSKYVLVKGFAWEACEIWVNKADLPTTD